VRQLRRQEIDANWRRSFDEKRRRSNARNRAASTDSVRIDLIDWLARKLRPDAVSKSAMTRIPEREVASPAQQADAGENNSHDLNRSADETAAGGDAVEGIPGIVGLLGGQSTASHAEPAVNGVDVTPVHHVEQLGNAIARSTYRALDEKFQGAELKGARTQLANHFWCDLFVALVIAIEKLQNLVNKIPKYVKKLILRSTRQGERSLVTKLVVGFAVDKAWAALTKLPIFTILPTGEILRALRILAILACPAPENHEEVCEHCIKPLKQLFSTETVNRLKAVLLKDWNEDLSMSAGEMTDDLLSGPAVATG
jgi:hypothetical protein